MPGVSRRNTLIWSAVVKISLESGTLTCPFLCKGKIGKRMRKGDMKVKIVSQVPKSQRKPAWIK